MTEQELRIARLSKIMNSGLRVKTGNFKAYNDACARVVTSLEQSLEAERKFNIMHDKKQQLLQKAEREQEHLRESIYRHHLSVLKKQIEEKRRNKLIEDKQIIPEKELTEELFKPKSFKMKEMLDQQIEEKRRINAEIKRKEEELDRLRLDLARRSLDSEMKNKEDGKKMLQNQLRESWDRTQNTNKLQKAIDRLRRFGDNYAIQSDDDEEEKDEIAIIKNRRVKEENLRKKRSKSVLSQISKSSHRAVLEKIGRLDEEERRIKKEKFEILSYLDSKANSKASSRLGLGSYNQSPNPKGLNSL